MNNEDKDRIKLTRRSFLQTVSAALAAAGIPSLAWSAAARDFDLVILNGRVMDPEKNFDAVANVGIRKHVMHGGVA